MKKPPWARVASIVLALLATSVAVAPSASAADCDVTQTPTGTVTSYSAYVSGAGTGAPRTNVSAYVKLTCGVVVSGTSGYAYPFNVSTSRSTSVPIAKYADDGATVYVTGSAPLNQADQYGRFVGNVLDILYKKKSTDLTTYNLRLYPDYTFYSRSTPYISNPYPSTQSVNEGDSTALTGYLYTVLAKQEQISLQILNGTAWETVDTVDVDIDTDSFAFIYTPTKSVTYRFFYAQTDWALAKASTPAVINFVPDVVVKKPPSAPPAFISDATTTTISLDWSPPADPNGTISAYRFGWDTPSGKPVPSYEDTYPTSGTVPDPLVFTKLNPGTDYTVWVEAVNENGRSARTTIATKTDDSPVIKPPPPPPPPPAARVAVGTRSKGGKLYVNVNPDKGAGYWRFTVQKRTASGKWVNKKTYKTMGAGETRTVNLAKGTYRVKVLAKYGYATTYSGSVTLTR